MFPVLHNSREIFPSGYVVTETRMHRRFTLHDIGDSQTFRWCTTKRNWTFKCAANMFLYWTHRAEVGKNGWQRGWVILCCQHRCVLANICGLWFVSLDFYPLFIFKVFIKAAYQHKCWHTCSATHVTVCGGMYNPCNGFSHGWLCLDVALQMRYVRHRQELPLLQHVMRYSTK